MATVDYPTASRTDNVVGWDAVISGFVGGEMQGEPLTVTIKPYGIFGG